MKKAPPDTDAHSLEGRRLHSPHDVTPQTHPALERALFGNAYERRLGVQPLARPRCNTLERRRDP